MRFPVRVADGFREATSSWVRPPASAEVNFLKAWKAGVGDAAAARDAAELAHLAAMKWQATCELGSVADSLAHLETLVRIDAKAEVTGMLLARAEWFEPKVIGVCLFHRTWAHNVFVDFLAVHPKATGVVSGVGYGLLHQLCEVSNRLQAALLWGETTESSSGYYAKVFQLPDVTDCLMVPLANQRAFHRSIEERWRIWRDR